MRRIRLHLTVAVWPLAISITVIPAALAGAPATAADDLKIMSFNIRFANTGFSEDKPENNWTDSAHPRRDRVVRIIEEFGPDLLGVQEARELQVKDLRAALPAYEFYGVGRDDGKSAGEHSGVFYRRDRFQRDAAGSFWLSPTPEKPGTTFHARPGAPPRIASWLKLEDRRVHREFILLNTHWDNESEEARQKSAVLVRARLATLAETLPTIVIGDLNCDEDSPAVKLLSNGREGPMLLDSFRAVHSKRQPDEATYHNWEGVRKGSRIDFILFTHDFKCTAADIVRTAYDGFWPSDHYPVTATLRWQTTK